MKRRIVLPAIVLLLNVVVSPLTAHHSVMADMDVTKPTHIEGTVVTIMWVNPHMYFTLREKDSTGAAFEWRVEASSPTILTLLGWTKQTLLPGMNVRVGGYASKNSGNKYFDSTTITLLSNQRVLKTPVCWFIPNNLTTLSDIENLNARCPIPEVP